MAYAGNVDRAQPIAAYPFLIATLDSGVKAFLDNLPFPDFSTVEETAALWASRATEKDGTTPGSAYVVSAEVFKRIKAHRY